jgi:OOP family OmpA-OmpF porin
MEYILSKGIEPSRITSQGYGETKPVAANDTDENRQLNRRVEFKIMKN